ncbi:MAG: HIRAN domain-containing protein [Ilumatobacteraceae bacterium]
MTKPAGRLAEGSSVSVSNEEHYQQALKTIRGAEREGRETLATLVVNEADNPWSTQADRSDSGSPGRREHGRFLTPAMTERYLPFARSAARAGQSLTAKAFVVDGTGMRSMDGTEWLAAVLRRDPNNEYDRNAIEVHVPGGSGHCGFVPSQLARILAPILDSGTIISAHAVEVRIHPESPNQPGLTLALTLATPSK